MVGSMKMKMRRNGVRIAAAGSGAVATRAVLKKQRAHRVRSVVASAAYVSFSPP